MKITYGAVLPLTPDEAFEFVSEPTNWPTFFEAMSSAESCENWGQVGGRARMTNRFLGRSLTTDLELTVWNPPHELRYLGVQAEGLPVMDNRRVFEPVAGGTKLTGTTEIQVRPGLSGLVDRLRIRALRRTFAKAMQRLPEVAKAQRTIDG